MIGRWYLKPLRLNMQELTLEHSRGLYHWTFSITHWKCEGRVSDGEECHVMALPQGSGMTRPYLRAITTHHTVRDTPRVCCLASWEASSHCISFRPEKMAMETSSVGAAAYCAGSHSHHILGPRTAAAASWCGLALCCGTAGVETEQSQQHAVTPSHSSSSNTLRSWSVILFCGTSLGKEREKSFQTTILGKT